MSELAECSITPCIFRIEFKKMFFVLVVVALISGFAMLSYVQTASALTPVADLTGTWSGFAVLQNVEGTCEFTGKVNVNIKQNGNQINGDYSYVGTGATPSSPDYYCYDFNYSENISGTIDGSRITLRSDSGTFSGSYASSGISLNIQSAELVGTVKLSPTNFTPPPFESKNKPPEQKEVTDVKEMVEIGLSHLNEKRFDKALEYFSKIVAKDPNNIMGWMGKGVSYAGLKKYDQAITHFKKSLELSPNNKDVLQWLARTYYLKNDCQVAADYYSAALKVDPQNSKIMAEKKIADSCLAKKKDAKIPEVTDKTPSASLDTTKINDIKKKEDEKKKVTKTAEEKKKADANKIEESIKKKAEEAAKRWEKDLIKLDKQEIELKALAAGKILQYEYVQKKLLSMVGKDENSMPVILFKHYSLGPDKSELAKKDYELEIIPSQWEEWIVKETKSLKDGRYNLSPYYDKKKKSGGPDDLVHTLGHFDVIVRTNPDGTRTYQIEDLYQFGYDLTKKLEEQRHGFTFSTQNKEKLDTLMWLCSKMPPVKHPVGQMEKCEVIKTGTGYKILIPQQILAAAGNPFVVRGEFTK